ncbi:sensor histidine kinase [Dyella sp.]|uniref:sensor histidine kinase n=1 Tax=Dyella sp. TaxID=1869338 RepID=UPI002D7968B5|nr:histidine kinase [Dyella sp.]HET6432822.1 histidine kinase [Dyella sp.]
MSTHSQALPDATPEPRSVRMTLLTRPLLLMLYFAGWIFIGLWQGTNVWISQRDNPGAVAWHYYTWELSSALVIGALALAVATFESRWRVTGPGAWRRLPVHLPAAVAFSLVHVVGIVALRTAAYAAMGSSYDFGEVWIGLVYEFQKDLITYASIVTMCALIRSVRERRRHQLEEIELRRALSEARLAHLAAQIEPHFVFNTLNAISNRMYEDVPAADRMIVALSDLLRSAMTADGSAFVRVSDEVHWLRAYTALMAERQPGLLHVDITVDDGLDAMRLPRLLLQPLVENAFRHGLRNGRGRLAVSLRRDGEQLHCRVEDDGVGFAADAQPGVGLANVRERLALLYPDRHQWKIGPGAQGGTAVDITLPLEPWAAEPEA